VCVRVCFYVCAYVRVYVCACSEPAGRLAAFPSSSYTQSYKEIYGSFADTRPSLHIEVFSKYIWICFPISSRKTKTAPLWEIYVVSFSNVYGSFADTRPSLHIEVFSE